MFGWLWCSSVVAIFAIIVGLCPTAVDDDEMWDWDVFVSKVTFREKRRLKKLLKVVLKSKTKFELYYALGRSG